MNPATLLTRTAEASRALVRSLRDVNDIESLLLGEEVTSVGRMRAVAAQLQTTDEGRAILAERPTINSSTVDLTALAAMAPGSLGRAYADHMARYGLDIDALGTRVTRGASEQDNYLLERVRQTHDIWHTMLGLGTAPHEEILVHAFQWPQLQMPYSAFVVGLGACKHLVPEARWGVLRRGLRAARRAGAAAEPMLAVFWEHHWQQPIDALRQQLNVATAATWPGVTPPELSGVSS